MASTHLRPYWSNTDRSRSETPTVLLAVAGALAGGLAALLFQHGTLYLLHEVGPKAPLLVTLFGEAPAPFSMAPGWLASIPLLIGDLLWGSAWGPVLALTMGRDRMPAAVSGALFGGIVLATVSLAVASLPGGRLPMAAPREVIALTTLLYAAWGWGTALMVRSLVRA